MSESNNSNCLVCGLPYKIHDTCPKCGYSFCDEMIHGDHRLCGQPLPKKPKQEESDGPK